MRGYRHSPLRAEGLGFRVEGLGFRVEGLGFRVEYATFWGSGFRVYRMCIQCLHVVPPQPHKLFPSRT